MYSERGARVISIINFLGLLWTGEIGMEHLGSWVVFGIVNIRVGSKLCAYRLFST